MSETPTQALHRLTSYEPEREWTEPLADPRIVQDLEVNDLDRLPWFFKRYADALPRIPLPRELPSTSSSALSVLSGNSQMPAADIDLAHVSRLLHLSAGVVRTVERPYGTYLFRAAGSAGGRFPLELYVIAPEESDLPPGVHYYDPLDHALVTIGPPPGDGAPGIVVTGVPWRTGWRYRERGYRHVFWDAGTMLTQLLAGADSAGIETRLYTRFPDAQVAQVVGADRVHEFPVAVVGFGSGPPSLETPASAMGEVDAAPLEFPLVTAAQEAGELEGFGAPWEAGAAVVVPTEMTTAPIEAVILARGSQRRMDPSKGLSEDLLRVSMQVALRGIGLEHFIVVHDVEGIEPGVYRWPDMSAPVHPGRLRDELYRVCLDQGLARDASFVVISAADIGTLNDHEYREAQLAAGLVEGRLHLLAYALGAGASGMTFLDSEIEALIGQPLQALLFTCVGVPGYRSAPGGSPGAPTSVRMVQPRL